MGIFTGPAAALRAGRLLIDNRALVPLALVPAIITCTVSIGGVWLAVAYGDDLVTRLWAEPDPGWLHWIWWATIQVVRVSSAFLAVFINPWLVLLFGVPLASPLANAVDNTLGGSEADVSLLSGLGRTVLAALCLTFIGISGTLVLFVLSFIPGLGTFAGPVAAFVWTPLILCYDLFDGAMSRRHAPIRLRVQTVLDRPITALSVGLTGLGLISIPIINLVGLPIAVVAGVIVIRDLEAQGEVVLHP